MRRFLVLLWVLGLGLSTSAMAAPAAPHHKLVIYFSAWSADVDDSAGKSIDEAAKWASEHLHDQVTVAGYASSSGSKRANALLSDLRAQIVKDQLVAKGIPAARIRLLPKGATTYIDSPLESRRVEISVDPK